jgi:hypothetical protein
MQSVVGDSEKTRRVTFGNTFRGRRLHSQKLRGASSDFLFAHLQNFQCSSFQKKNATFSVAPQESLSHMMESNRQDRQCTVDTLVNVDLNFLQNQCFPQKIAVDIQVWICIQ